MHLLLLNLSFDNFVKFNFNLSLFNDKFLFLIMLIGDYYNYFKSNFKLKLNLFFYYNWHYSLLSLLAS